jgi:hypothetical protein
LAAIPSVPSGPKSGAIKTPGRFPFSASEDLAGSNRTWRLEGKSSVVILGIEASAVLELSEHPGRMGDLIQSGSLFTVPRGTAIKVGETANGVMKILILEGSMAGREGWVQASQVSPRYRSSEQTPTPESQPAAHR